MLTDSDVSPISLHGSKVIQGDAARVLKRIPSETIQCCVTSPPYWALRDYGVKGQIGLEESVDQYINNLVAVFQEVYRVLRPDGSLWLNAGDSYTSGGRTWRAPDRKNPVRAMSVRPDTPTGLKPKELIGIPWRLAFALQKAGWYLRSDIIWCLSGGATVYVRTQEGDMPMLVKDLARLDPKTVKLWNGDRWTQARGWSQSPRPEQPIEIELRSGERIGCTPGHMWPTQRGNVRANELCLGDVILTTTLPEPESPITSAGLPEELTGWFVGLYLAEGSRSGDTIQIASHIKELERLQKAATAYHGTCRMHQTSSNGATINLNEGVLNAIIDTYIGGRTAADKHLTVACWQRNNTFLRAVLDGYLSGDGHYDAQNDRWRIGFTRNYALESSLRTLAARLGLHLRLKRSQASMGGRKFPAFRGEIRFSASHHHNSKPGGEVVRIGSSRARQFWDIGVAEEPHLFALASGVLTHNSKPNAMPESVKDRPTKSHEYIFLLTKSEKYYYDYEAVKEQSDAGGGPRNRRSVWSINTAPFPEAHFATFPPALVEPCIRAGSKPGDYVLDPFFGSGTVGVVSRNRDWKYIGVELNPGYVRIALNRLVTLLGEVPEVIGLAPAQVSDGDASTTRRIAADEWTSTGATAVTQTD